MDTPIPGTISILLSGDPPVSAVEESARPREPSLLRAWPNPFARETRLAFDLPVPGRVRISIFDVTGRIVARLEDAAESAGPRSLAWDGRGPGGRPLEAGLYFARLEAPGWTTTHKLVIRR
ncbi:MAG: Ig domain-containing protein group 2 domain-containing protein [bacterium]|nr:MAG: Ig domain-containing protein group 2 domain-containing protein [bacterium]